MTGSIHMLGAADAKPSAMDRKIAARQAKARATMDRPDVRAVRDAFAAQARAQVAQRAATAPAAPAQESWLLRRVLGPVPGYGVVAGAVVVGLGAVGLLLRRVW